jgi:hypothetical protein
MEASEVISLYFTGDSLKRMLTHLCNTRQPGGWDPITATVLDLLTSRLQPCLTATGLQAFQGRADLLYPYHMMSVEQKDFIRRALQDRTAYTVCNGAVMFKCRREEPSTARPAREALDPVEVLQAMCCKVLESNVHAEKSVRVGVCNILLQRVQSAVPISKGMQKRLNALLFQ